MKKDVSIIFTNGIEKDFVSCSNVIVTETDITFLDAVGKAWHFKVAAIAGFGIKELADAG